MNSTLKEIRHLVQNISMMGRKMIQDPSYVAIYLNNLGPAVLICLHNPLVGFIFGLFFISLTLIAFGLGGK